MLIPSLANEEKRKLYASYLTACCHPENTEKGNRRIFLDLIEKIDINGILILKELTTRFNGKEAIGHFTTLFDGELSKNDIMIQLDYLTSYRLIEKCTQEEIERFYARLGNVKARRPINYLSFYKRTVMGDALYQFVSKGII